MKRKNVFKPNLHHFKKYTFRSWFLCFCLFVCLFFLIFLIFFKFFLIFCVFNGTVKIQRWIMEA